MALLENTATSPAEQTSGVDGRRPGEYVVVARRYRPQTFDELVGQEHVARALSNAISTQRVGHAYLFTGARGVGKTSAARILAKALNCQQGPSPKPCNHCDICRSISAGSDIDVLEIDGASNRGIDEIRQLRQNVNIRPSRAHFKIYIIDEVHMLTREAFNALLKTLEEPPEHVKFIFCTTEATKIPITILSRCQRFDFAGIRLPSIIERLGQIAASEGVSAEPAALAILARRANGSMRDSQSLLEQLLSFGEQHITARDVHLLLGTAGDARMSQLASHLVARDRGAALAELDSALAEGVDVGQLLEQLLGFFRDCMASAVGCGADAFLYAPADAQEQVKQMAAQLGLETILSAMQILDHTQSRLRYSTQGRTLAELALVQICSLENLQELSQLIAQLRGTLPVEPVTINHVASSPAADESGAKKKGDLESKRQPSAAMDRSVLAMPAGPLAAPARAVEALSPDSAQEIWQRALSNFSDLLAENASRCDRVAICGPDQLAVTFASKYNSCKLFCERPDQLATLEKALSEASGGPIKVRFFVRDEEKSASMTAGAGRKGGSQRQRLAEKAEHPMVRRAAELFGAHPERIEDPDA